MLRTQLKDAKRNIKMQSKVAFNGHSLRGVEEEGVWGGGGKGGRIEAMPKASDDQAHTITGFLNPAAVAAASRRQRRQ